MDVCPLEDGNYGSDLPNITNALPQSNMAQGERQRMQAKTHRRNTYGIISELSEKYVRQYDAITDFVCIFVLRLLVQAKEDGFQPSGRSL